MQIAKPENYYGNIRYDILNLLQTGRHSSILELGCGEGATGRAILEAGKAGRYVGIELDVASARMAKQVLSEVLVGDVARMDLSSQQAKYDVLIMGEVIEHLPEPWTIVDSLVKCVKIGGLVLASSPNIAHWRIIAALLAGRFDYKEIGIMDRTHLRWFTPKTYRELFDDAGVEVVSIKALAQPGTMSVAFNAVTFGVFNHLTVRQMMLVGKRRS
jgi:2-polyprenyl-3-methyl-5-hydroxy-6-metoxy-1,4-benzoquinol methylase